MLIINFLLFCILVKKFLDVVPIKQVKCHIKIILIHKLGSKFDLGELSVHRHPFLRLLHAAAAEVHRVHPGDIPGLRGLGHLQVKELVVILIPPQVRGAQSDVVWGRETADERCWT